MKTTPLEIRTHQIKKSFRGYDIRDVEALRDIAAEALEEANRQIMEMEDKLKDKSSRLEDLMSNETMLKETITAAQKMVEDFKSNARKEAELLITEAKLQGEEIIKLAQARSLELQEEIYRLKKQRIELETSIKAIIDYHSSTLVLEGDNSRKADEGSEKLKFLSK